MIGLRVAESWKSCLIIQVRQSLYAFWRKFGSDSPEDATSDYWQEFGYKHQASDVRNFCVNQTVLQTSVVMLLGSATTVDVKPQNAINRIKSVPLLL